VFPALVRLAPPETSSGEPEAVAPAIEVLRADSRLLEARGAAAVARETRPGSTTASEGHDTLAEVRSLARYGSSGEHAGEDGNTPPTLSQLPPARLRHSELRQEAMDVGSAFHAALETLDLEAEGDALRAALERDLAFWLPPGSPPTALSRARSLIERFVTGPLPARLRALGPHLVARELPVLLEPEELEGQPTGFVSGAIDLLYRDPVSGAWVVADYKSDAVDGEAALAERAAAYRGQGRVYVRAVQRALALAEPPRFELWFLHPGRVIPLPEVG